MELFFFFLFFCFSNFAVKCASNTKRAFHLRSCTLSIVDVAACCPSAYMSTNKGVPHGTLLLFFFGSSNCVVKCASSIQHAIQHRSCTLSLADVAACSPNAYMSTNNGVPHDTLLPFFLVPQILLQNAHPT